MHPWVIGQCIRRAHPRVFHRVVGARIGHEDALALSAVDRIEAEGEAFHSRMLFSEFHIEIAVGGERFRHGHVGHRDLVL